MKPFGFDAFAVGRVITPDAAGEFFLMTWPSGWIEHYAVNGLVSEDPVVLEARARPEPFTWTELKTRRPGEGQRMYDAAATYGWVDGYAVPIHGPGLERGLVSMAAPSVCLTPRDRSLVTELSLLTYERARALAPHRAKIRRLSAREREALALVAVGKDDSQIATLMSVSRTTAHAHVERAKRRLGASTRAQAVAIATVSRLI